NIIDDKISEVRINKNSILNDIVFEEYNISFQIINNKNKVEFSKNNLIKLFDYDKIEKEIIIRHRRDGDKIIPLGMKGNKKLKDIFIDMKIPREKRDEVPILCFDEKIAWVVGYKTSQESRITQDTKNILKITFDRKE
ncbi:MAG: tRNA lysidine(34) synthetase TilS, partial [Clostridia bacterium]